METLEDQIVEDACGICVSHSLHDTHSMMKALQHRGREGAGIFFFGKNRLDVIKWRGSVDMFDLSDFYKMLPMEEYHTFGGHVRYATQGRKDRILDDAHPHVIGGETIERGNHVIILNCQAAIIHNGQVNSEYLKEINKSELKTGCDTERVLHFFRENGEEGMLKKIPGAYTLAIADMRMKDVIIARDGTGIKPGVLGWKDGKSVIASEDIAFGKIGAEFVEDLTPGSVYYLQPEGNYKERHIIDLPISHCFFEWNYIAHADSIINRRRVSIVRENLGEMLAEECIPTDADIVSFLPRCPAPAAKNYAKASGIKLEYIFYKPHSERAFMGSTSQDRASSIGNNLYLSPIVNLKNKNIILIDDSTVRGNNSKRAIKMLKEAGSGKVYLLNYTPKIGITPRDKVPRGCSYGVDMPPEDDFIVRVHKDGLITNENRSDEEIANEIGADKVYFLSKQGMLNAFKKSGVNPKELCTFCIGGKRPF